MEIDRRSVLVAGFSGMACAGLGPRPVPAGEIDLASRMVRAKRSEALDLAGRALRDGAGRDAILASTFLAGVTAIAPRVLGSEWHAVMMMASIDRVGSLCSAEEADAAALWGVDEFKASQERARERWALPAARALDVSAATAEEALIAGIESNDPEKAQRAVSALVAALGAAFVFERLWAYGALSFGAAGHHVIAVAQTERALRRFGAAHAEPALRALVLGLAEIERGPDTAAADSARALAAEVPASWEGGAEDPERSLEVLRAVRGHSPSASQRAVVDALADGLGPRTVWDGLRLHAAELVLLRPARRRVLPIHTLTEMEALGHAATRAESAPTRLFLLLQAAAWMAQARDAIVQRNGAHAAGPTIDSALEEASDPNEVRKSRSGAHLWTALEADPSAIPALEAEECQRLVERATASHHYKFLAAAMDESARVHPRWRARVLACGLDYLPAPDEPATEVHERALRHVRR